MHYQDMSPYSYLIAEGRTLALVRNVGWLSEEHPFPTGDIDASALPLIANLCQNPSAAVHQTRGFHDCPFCNQEIEIYDKGVRTLLGSAEIWVANSEGCFFAAPDLILHYITVHRYVPPAEFIEAVRWTWDNQWYDGNRVREKLVRETQNLPPR